MRYYLTEKDKHTISFEDFLAMFNIKDRQEGAKEYERLTARKAVLKTEKKKPSDEIKKPSKPDRESGSTAADNSGSKEE